MGLLVIFGVSNLIFLLLGIYVGSKLKEEVKLDSVKEFFSEDEECFIMDSESNK